MAKPAFSPVVLLLPLVAVPFFLFRKKSEPAEPRETTLEGPPPPPQWLIKPGWYWYWVKPTEAADWADIKARWTPNYVLKPKQTWGAGGMFGTLELFEVTAELIWTLPDWPTPAPFEGDTTVIDILGGYDDAPGAFRQLAEWTLQTTWTGIQEQFDRLRNLPRVPWPWSTP